MDELKLLIETTPALIAVFWQSPDDSYHTTDTIAAVTGMSLHTLSNKRSIGGGIKFVKCGHLIYHRKIDVVEWFKSFGPPVASTSALSARDSQRKESILQAA